MSKRHQSSRRKTYGRRQHEVRERHDRGQHTEGFEFELGEWGTAAPGRSARRSSIRAARASASRSATERWPSTRAPAHARSRCRAGRASPSARRSTRRRVRGAVRAGRGPNRLGIVLGGHRRRVHARVLLARPAGPRVRDRATTSAGCELDRQRLDDRGCRAPVRPEPARSRAGHPQAGHRRRPRPAGRAARPAGPTRRSSDRCWAGPIRAAACSSCSASSCVGVARARRPARATGRSSTASGWPSQAAGPDDRHASTSPSKRGDIYDRTGTVVLATTVQRERLVAAPTQLTPEQRKATVATLTADPRPRRRPPR